MTWEAARQSLYAAFIAGWAASSHSSLEYFFPGQTFPDLTDSTQGVFAIFRVIPRETRQSGLAGATPPKRRFGVVSVDVFKPIADGDKQVIQVLDTLEGLFSATTISTIVFQRFVSLDSVEGTNWESRTVLAHFYFD